MYDDSDESYSFCSPHGDRKCYIHSPTIAEKISSNVNDLANYGRALTAHVLEEIKMIAEQEFDSDDSCTRKPKAIDVLLDRATANIRTITAQITEQNPCMSLVRRCDDDSYYSSSEEEVRPPKTIRRKKSSEVREHSGRLKDDITVTSDEDRSHSSITSGDNDSQSSEYTSSESDSIQKRSLASKMRRRRQQYLRRKAMERAATADSSGTDGEVSDRGYFGPRLGCRKKALQYIVPTQELRSVDRHLDSTITNVDTEETMILNTSNADESQKKVFNHQLLKWESKETSIILPPSPVSGFLTSSHLGPIVTRVPCSSVGDAMQLGDIIIRLNGEDVSNFEGEIVSEIFKQLAGKIVRATYLRKKVEV